MKILYAPQDMKKYFEFSNELAVHVRLQLGMSHIFLNYRIIRSFRFPLLLIDFFNAKDKLCTVKIILPSGTQDSVLFRIEKILYQLRRNLYSTSFNGHKHYL